MPRRPTLLIIAMFAAAACGPKSGGTGPRVVDVGAFPALRWAPADVAYAAVGTSVDGALMGARDLLETAGILGDFDVADIQHEIKSHLGFDPLSPDDLAQAGIDLPAGGALFSHGFSPTFVFKLADPAAMQNRIDVQREKGGSSTAIGVAVRDGVEVFTDLGNREVHTAWAIDGNWMWVHFEIVDEHETELMWFDASRAAAGALAKEPDFMWARAEAERIQPGAPFTGLVRINRLAMKVAAMANEPEATACMSLVTTPRAAFSINSTAGVSEGHLIIDTAGGGVAIKAGTLPVPSGWPAARDKAAIAAEWNIDVGMIARYFSRCSPEPAQRLVDTGVRAIRGMLISVDVDNLDGRAAVSAELAHRRFIDKMMSFTGRSMFESKKKYGTLDGTRFSAPMAPTIDYILTNERAMAAVGDGLLVEVVGDGSSTPSVLAALDIRPPALPEAAWSFILENAGGVSGEGRRGRTIKRLNRWKRGTITLTLEGDLVNLHARGERP